MVQIGKLWGDRKFTSLSPLSKLLYCYIISQPSITTLGIVDLQFNKVLIDLGMDISLKSNKGVDDSLEVLEELGYIVIDRKESFKVLVTDHYKSLAKSKLNVRKAIQEFNEADGATRELLSENYVAEDFVDESFVPPTAGEVSDYALSLGFVVDGKKFVEYYENNDWYDKNNKKVRAWKAKVRKVWCREENKLKTVKGAPKGFEYFFVELEEGVRIFPESWVDGYPSHSNFIYAEYLTEEFNEQKDS